MPELRKDPVIGRWVIMATERVRRPGNIVEFEDDRFCEEVCPFCEGKEGETTPEIFAIRDNNLQVNNPGWFTRVIPSKNPLFGIEGDLNRHGHGLYDVMHGVGAHEVVIETPQHIYDMADLSVEQIEKVINTYVARLDDLKKDPRFKHIMIFKKHGISAGSNRIKHSRSHIIAMPVNPKVVKEKLTGAKRYYDYHERCIYCDLIRQEIETKERVLFDSKNFVALMPFASRFSFETWIIPKNHNCDFSKGVVGFQKDCAEILKNVLSKLKKGLGERAYNFVLHTAPLRSKNPKPNYWKTIANDYHWHIEIIPRLTHIAGFEKGTGFYICPMPPENTTEYLRGIQTDV